MKKLPLSLVVVLAVLGIAPALSATKPVDITNKGFKPNKVTVDFGDTVIWTNKDTANHQVVADKTHSRARRSWRRIRRIRSRSSSPGASATATA